MRILKSNQGDMKLPSGFKQRYHPERSFVLRRRDQEDAELARRMVTEAKNAAKQILETAEREVETYRRTAYEQAKERAEDEAKTTCTQFLMEAKQRELERLQTAKADLIRLAVRIAEKVIRHELTLTPQRVTAFAEDCLLKVRDSRRVLLKVHEHDVPQVESWLASTDQALLHEHILVCADSKLSPGDCVVETELGAVDGRIATQLQAIEEAIQR